MQSPNLQSESAAPTRGVYAVPALSKWQEYATRTVAVVAWLYSIYWIAWRWTSTLNWDAPVFSLTLVLAETYGIVMSTLLLMTVWRLKRREPPPAPVGRTVDVFITCYDEPLQLIRRTALGACAIRYPHKTYILDDGKRNEVRAMARSLGIGYIRRKGNEHAKAGNLNNAIRHTRGEFILQLDADHVPLPHILDRVLGYFDDERVAFVQTPQDFYNTSDSFTHVVNDEARRMWEENRIFFSLIQPGKDALNAAFFCGSCGILRREALQSIGGFSTNSVTEDMETSIVLHSRGWRSVYHGETLAYGLAPASAGQYHVQRLRWGQGSMQILRKMNPLFYRGLTWKQRLQYFASVASYFDGLQKLVFYLAPLVFLYTGALPVRVSDRDLMIRLVPYILLTITSFELLSRGTGWILISERYNMTKFFTYILATSALFTRKPLKFKVTPKGEGDVPWRTYAPQLAIAVLSICSLPFAFFAYRNEWIEYDVSGVLSAAFLVNTAWVCWNLYFAGYVVRHSVLSRQQRSDYRFMDSLPVQVQPRLAAASAFAATVQDLNTGGLSFRATERLEPGTQVDIPLALTTALVATRGAVRRLTPIKTRFGHVYVHGVQFDDELPIADRDAIELHCTQHAVPLWQRRYRQSVHVLRHFAERMRDLRVAHRRPVQLPAVIRVHGTDTQTISTVALLEEVSRDGARLIMDAPALPGSTVEYEVPGTALKGAGTVVFNRAFESPRNIRFAVGICTNECRPSWVSRAVAWGRRVTSRAPIPALEPAVLNAQEGDHATKVA